MRKLYRMTAAVPAALALVIALGMAGPATAGGATAPGVIAMGQCDEGKCDKDGCDKKAADAVRAQPLCDADKDDEDDD